MTLRPSKESRRVLAVAFSLFVFFSLLVIQFYRLQVRENEKWVASANHQHLRVVKDNFRRGKIYSNSSIKFGHVEKPTPFTYDVLKYHLYVDSDAISEPYKAQVADVITSFLKLDAQKKAFIEKEINRTSRSRKLIQWLNIEEKALIQNWFIGFAKQCKIPTNALFFIKDYKRVYPFGKLLGQALHTVRDRRDEITLRAIPTGGLESVFDDYLSGNKGKRVVLRSGRNQIETKKVIQQANDGCDVYLTINHYLQAICEEELQKGVEKVKGKSGVAVLMDPHSGEVWAMAQYPFFHPAHYRDYYNDPESLSATSIMPISECFEPGSTIKALTVALGLLANKELSAQSKKPIFDPDKPIAVDDPTFPGRGPLRDVRKHNFLNMDMAIQKSSNIYVAKLAGAMVNQLGASWYRSKLSKVFGLGVKSGIELPYENPGFLPTPGKTYGAGKLQWSTPTPFSLAMGYNLMANSIQMARAFSVIANGGYLVYPTLVKKIVNPEGEIVAANINSHPPKRVLDQDICDRVTRSLKFVTKKGGGGMLGDVFGYTEAAKSSTSEKLLNGIYDKTRHFSTFIGFCPATKPKFVLFISVDEPEKRFIPGFGTTHFGGKCSAPIFREIAKKSLAYLGVKPDDPYGYAPKDPRRDEELADWVLESKELMELYKQWNSN
ncbi:MAG: penicillin-binding protein 2 [Rhabdochlamydiaceae bacterium]|nr:penicillin-binding protein 2 [Candidatus Amphrikana amoebophyrae]